MLAPLWGREQSLKMLERVLLEIVPVPSTLGPRSWELGPLSTLIAWAVEYLQYHLENAVTNAPPHNIRVLLVCFGVEPPKSV